MHKISVLHFFKSLFHQNSINGWNRWAPWIHDISSAQVFQYGRHQSGSALCVIDMKYEKLLFPFCPRCLRLLPLKHGYFLFLYILFFWGGGGGFLRYNYMYFIHSFKPIHFFVTPYEFMILFKNQYILKSLY